MREDILIVEYEPRYTERVRQAAASRNLAPVFAKDGDEALRALGETPPRIIVLSSVIPKISTAELIRQIRTRSGFELTPILLTVSGYNGKSPKSDALRVGATDILPKPYSEEEFIQKIDQLLGQRTVAGGAWGELPSDVAVHPSKTQVPEAMLGNETVKLTSNEIFGDLLEDDKTVVAGTRKTPRRPVEDLDKILADTLSGARPSRKREEPAAGGGSVAAPAAAPGSAPPAAKSPDRAKTSRADLDRLLEDTLSGLDRNKVRTPEAPPPAATAAVPVVAAPAAAQKPAELPRPAAPPASAATTAAAAVRPAPAPAAPAPGTPAEAARAGDEKVHQASPMVFPKAVPPPPLKEEDAEEGGIRFGQYVLRERIATGGMAEVWKARMRGVEGFQKTVAIKKILPHLSDNEDFVTMFIDEAKLAAQLNHNNIIHIYDLGKIASSYYIAMEYIDGQDLKSILRRAEDRGQPISVEIALFIASKIAAALDYAHRKRDFDEKEMGLVHRDVSPQNVLISYEGDIKLCDFGIAKAASKASHTQAGALKGKLQYMSPEQAWGKSIDRRSDIFALATVLFEMLTGRKLFTGDNEISVLEQVREARVIAPSEVNDEVSPEVDAIVLKALQKDPDARYDTAGEMARDLDGVLYSFRPTPTSADLAIFMHRLYFAEESAAATVVQELPRMEDASAPSRDTTDIKATALAASAGATAAAHVDEAPVVAAAEQTDQTERKRSWLPIAVGIALVAAIAGGAFVFSGGDRKSETERAGATGSSAVPSPAQPAPGAAAPIVGTTDTAATTAAPALTDTTAEQALIDQEVQRRLAAERARLEQQRAAQLAAQRAAAADRAADTAPAPAPRVAETQPQPTQPPPARVEEARQQEPAPQQTPPPAAPAPRQETAPAQVARAREGDVVPAGTPGLTPPEMTNFRKPTYPEIARRQRTEGIVVLSALISETGKVLEVKVLRGVPLLNDAAADAVRRSTFRPATKDGVRVRSTRTVTVPFKL